MKKELLAKWVGALRSGDYVQTSGVMCVERLNDNDLANPPLPQGNGESMEFCCLGVLCDVMGLERSPQTADMDDPGSLPQLDYARDGYVYDFKMPIPAGTPDSDRYYYRGSEVLPEELRKQLGINDRLQRVLTEANDEGTGFDEIADMLEDHIICEDETTKSIWITEPITTRYPS